MTNLIASTAPAIPVPSPPAPAASPPLIFAPTGAAEAQSAQSSESGPPSPPWVATVLEARGKVEFSRAGAKLWDEVPRSSTNRLVLYPGDRLRTHEKSRAVLRLSDSNVVTVAEHSVLQVAPPPNKRTGFDLLRGMMYFFQRDKSAEPKIKTPAAGASIRG